MPVVHADAKPRTPVEALRKRRLAWVTNGKNERKRFGGETPTDARLFCRALRAWPRLQTAGAHLSAFHRGSRPKESFIARDSAPGFCFLGPGGQVAAWPSSGRYPPLPVPVQRGHRGLVIVPGG